MTVGRIEILPGFLYVLAVFAALVMPASAMAQIKDVTPYMVVVTKDKADLRSGESGNFYKVMELPAGEVLRVDGEGADWARVIYPASATAFVRADEVSFDEAAKTARLTQPSRLRAANMTAGIAASWKALMSQPLASGTVLKVLEPAKDDEGRVVGYRIAPPDGSRGFVRRADVRQATPAEAQAYRVKMGMQEEAPRPGDTGDVGRTPPAPGASPAAPATADKPESATAQPANDPAVKPLMDPIVKPGDEPKPADGGAAPGTAPAGEQPVEIKSPSAVEPANTTSPVSTDGAATTSNPSTAPAPPSRSGPTLDEVERAFENVRRQSPDDAEYQALIAEYQKLQAELRPEQDRRCRQLQQRVDWLQMKLDLRDKQRQFEDMRRKADDEGRQVSTRLADLERQRQYAIVGRLLPSTVYDGTNLPLMYRLQSVTGGTTPRTIGYLKPDTALDLPTKLNMVVGVIGEVKLDPAMSLNVITAQRVDVLQAVDGGPVRNP